MNEMRLIFQAVSANESFARVTAAAFMTQMNPTLSETEDVKTAVSEAVTNCVVHAYPKSPGEIELRVRIDQNELELWVTDWGIGIADTKKAREPLYTTAQEKGRSGMGFCFMETFMDRLEIQSVLGKGTCVHMKKKISRGKAEEAVTMWKKKESC